MTDQTMTAPTTGLWARARTALADYRARSAIYHRTLRELSAASDRELADMGIARGDIPGIARTAAADI